jgi:hypothetical protein
MSIVMSFEIERSILIMPRTGEAKMKGAGAPRRVLLDLARHDAHADIDEAVRNDLSVITPDGPYLFAASDETATIERLTAEGPDRYGDHRTFRLHDLVDLPDAEGEVDIEGMDVEGDWLWVVGSHSLARRRPKPEEQTPEQMLERLTQVKAQANRHLLARIPLTHGDRIPVRADGERRAAWLKFSKGGNGLTKALAKDPTLAPFLGIPAKENGLDIEGLAVCGDRAFLGLRGPVLRGWAVVLEAPVRCADDRLRLGPKGAEPYVRHMLDLDGLGIRELFRDGRDLLVLAGPTMDLDGPVKVWRWRDAIAAEQPQIVPRTALEAVLDVPNGIGFDHAEGIALRTAPGGGREILVAFDNPGRDRLAGETAVWLDAFPLPAPVTAGLPADLPPVSAGPGG